MEKVTGWITYAAFLLALLCTCFGTFIYVSVSDAERLNQGTLKLLTHLAEVESSIRNSDYSVYVRSAGAIQATPADHPLFPDLQGTLQELDERWKPIIALRKEWKALPLPSEDAAVLKRALQIGTALVEHKRLAIDRILVAEASIHARRTQLASFIYERSRYLVVLVLMLAGLVVIIGLQFRANRRDFEAWTLATKRLCASEEQYRGLFENVVEGVYQTDRAGRILTANPALVRMLGFDTEEQLKRSANTRDFYVDPVEREQFLQRAKAQGELRNVELNLRRNDGQIITVLDNARPVYDASGEIVYYQGTLTDITERKLFESEVAEARDAALQASRMKSEFLANMSHEVRTPMNGILGMTGMLLDGELTGEQREYAVAVQRSASHLLQIINDVLDLSKIEAGRLELEHVPFDLRTAIEDVFDTVLDRAAEKKLDLVCNIHKDVPAFVKGDPGRLRQVLTNLIGNAVKFTPSGVVSVNVALISEEPELVLRFAIADTGVGIRSDQITRIFEPFCQGDGSITRKYGGTGLGLTISRRLVHLMRGALTVSSSVGHGSTFDFTTRFEPTTQPAAANNFPAGTRALIVDPSDAIRNALETLLERWGIDSDSVRSVDSAIAMVHRAPGRTYDFVLADQMQLHETTMDLLRGQRSFRVSKLIVLTGPGGRNVTPHGALSLVAKPVKSSRLLEALRQTETDPVPRGKAQVVTIQSQRILVAEDHSINQKVAMRMLERMGHRVDVAANGLEALDALARRSYALVFMDCQMPEMDGFEATRQIRGRESGTSRLPIVAMTAHAYQEDRERCRAAGMDDFLSKPISFEDLETMVIRWLTRPVLPVAYSGRAKQLRPL